MLDLGAPAMLACAVVGEQPGIRRIGNQRHHDVVSLTQQSFQKPLHGALRRSVRPCQTHVGDVQLREFRADVIIACRIVGSGDVDAELGS